MCSVQHNISNMRTRVGLVGPALVLDHLGVPSEFRDVICTFAMIMIMYNIIIVSSINIIICINMMMITMTTA